jgi:hypothetical protein
MRDQGQSARSITTDATANLGIDALDPGVLETSTRVGAGEAMR